MNMNMNNFSDKLNFFNNSFTMNGKQGWICTSCKNFNYESKYLIILFILQSELNVIDAEKKMIIYLINKIHLEEEEIII